MTFSVPRFETKKKGLKSYATSKIVNVLSNVAHSMKIEKKKYNAYGL